jgi:hypothetical protein
MVYEFYYSNNFIFFDFTLYIIFFCGTRRLK